MLLDMSSVRKIRGEIAKYREFFLSKARTSFFLGGLVLILDMLVSFTLSFFNPADPRGIT